ncbi:GNAT family N-acetyltransferase [Alkalihalophilus pseudofirmus]|uniref:GNAT family N-acetyltransferase n=1 Tax=Alkalihalophilus pseudofirmus TaxID=79885 RepID=UPI00338F233C
MGLLNIRKANVADAAGIAKVHVDSWRTTYKGLFSDKLLAGLSYEEREKSWIKQIPTGHVFVAENDNSEVIGFAAGGKERSGNYEGYDGELHIIYLLKDYQGQGIGVHLVRQVVDEMIRSGYQSMLCLVLEGNPSRYFYEAIGGKLIDRVEGEIRGEKVIDLVYCWDHLDSFKGD